MKDTSYRQLPLGQEAVDYLTLKRKRLTETSERGYEACLATLARFYPAHVLADFEPPAGTGLLGRFLAVELRARVERLLSDGAAVTIDFSGVEAMSPSFADELFAKVPREAIESGQLQFENLADDLLRLARFVADGREPASRD